MGWFRKGKKKGPEDFNITCPRCKSEDVGFIYSFLGLEGGYSSSKGMGGGAFKCQQCGLIFRIEPNGEVNILGEDK